MSTINVKCPHCGAMLQGDDAMNGMNVLCPHCRNMFQFPNSIIQSEESDNNQIAPSQSEENEKTVDVIQRKCPNCGANIEKGMRFCSQCGTMSTAQLRICSNCNSPIVEGMHFCHKCGLLITEKYEKTFLDNVGTTVKGATNMLGNLFGKIKSNLKGEVN